MSTKTNAFALFLFCLFTVILCHRHPPFRRPGHHRDSHAQFKKFHHTFRRPYRHGTQEYLQRFEAFKINLDLIDQFNSQRKHNSSARYGITKFSDLTPDEFKAKYLSSLHPTARPTLLYSTQKVANSIKNLPTGKLYNSNSVLKAPAATNPPGLPLKVDLRGKNVLGPVRNQKACGGCWAFSVVEMVETVAALQSTVQVPLSVQEVIDCSTSFRGILWGCKGGDTCNALTWLQETQKPLVPEEKYPLNDKSEPCHLPNSTKTGVKVVNYTCEDLTQNEEKIQLYLATKGPVTVSVDATTWNNYMGGIIQFHCGESSNNHAVLIVGYDKTGDIPFYIVKNSWGTDFGDNGYLYIMMGGSVCGIAHEVSTVKVKM